MNKIKYILVGIIVFILGWIIGLLVKDWNWFQYDSSFNLFELLYCIFTLSISLYIAHIIENVSLNKRNQKDIIIKKVEEVDNKLILLVESFKYDKNKYTITNFHILSMTKHISQLSQRYEKSIKKYYPALIGNSNFHLIKTRNLVKYCTDLPKNKSDTNIECSNDIWYYSEEKFVDIQKEINKLRDYCFENILLLNEQ